MTVAKHNSGTGLSLLPFVGGEELKSSGSHPALRATSLRAPAQRAGRSGLCEPVARKQHTFTPLAGEGNDLSNRSHCAVGPHPLLRNRRSPDPIDLPLATSASDSPDKLPCLTGPTIPHPQAPPSLANARHVLRSTSVAPPPVPP